MVNTFDTHRTSKNKINLNFNSFKFYRLNQQMVNRSEGFESFMSSKIECLRLVKKFNWVRFQNFKRDLSENV